MKLLRTLFILAGLPVLLAADAFAVVECKVKFMDGRPMVCQDGSACVFRGAPSWMSCRCSTVKGDTDCLPVKAPAGRPNKGPFGPQYRVGEDSPNFQVQSRAERLATAAAHRDSGTAGYKKGDFARAIIDWNKAIALDPDLGPEITPLLAKAYGKRGAARYLAGESERAIADFDESLKLNPDSDDIRNSRALAVQANQRAPVELMNEPRPRAPVFQVKKTSLPWDQVLRFLMFGLAWFGLSLIGLFTAGYAVFSENRGSSTPARLRFDSYPEFIRRFSAELESKTTALIVLGGVLGVLSFFYYYWLIRARWEELTGKKEDSAVYAPLPAVILAKAQPQAEEQPVSSILGEAREMVMARKYEAALELLAKHPSWRLDLNYYDLFLEIYVRLADFSRARLMLAQVNREVQKKPGGSCAYNLYLSLASVCRDKGEEDLARQLREAGVQGMIKTVPVGEAPEKLYTLALSFENEGDTEFALRIYKMLMDAERPYRDTEERYKNLKAKPAAPPPSIPQISANRQSLRTAAQVIGMVLDKRFEIKGDLGEGAMGVVYEGWDRRQNSKVAVKRMHSWLKAYPEEYGRFKQEAEIVGKLKHPNIVGVRAIVETEGDIYLVFDYVDGKPASAVLKERKRFPLKECKEIFKGVCAAVHYAHKNNVVHRDLKPSNIMLDSSFHAMVVDFGLASELRESLTRVTHQTMSGTPAYMAPEQALGVVKREADIYAMGVCLYEMLTGELPFNGPDTLKQKNEKVYREVSSLFPWLPAGVDGLLARALEPAPSQRIDDALDFYDGLKDL